MKWSERFAIGIPVIDEQHRMLFRMSDDYRAALGEARGERVYGLLLESLQQYARVHFGMEEQCMHRFQCPVAAENADAHGWFLRHVAEFTERYAADGFRQDEAQRLVDFLDDWLSRHIGGIDVHLRNCVPDGECWP